MTALAGTQQLSVAEIFNFFSKGYEWRQRRKMPLISESQIYDRGVNSYKAGWSQDS